MASRTNPLPLYRAERYAAQITGQIDLLPDPDVNVTKFVPPPLLDYAMMKAEADKKAEFSIGRAAL